MSKSIGFMLKLTVLALALALTTALPLDSPIPSDAESVADVSNPSSRSLAVPAEGANPPATAIPAATTVEVAPESRAPPSSISVPDSEGEHGSRFLGGSLIGGGDSSKPSSKKSKSGSGGVSSKKPKKSKKKGQSGGSAELESGEFTMTITKGSKKSSKRNRSGGSPKKPKKKKNGPIPAEVSVEVESDEVGVKKGPVKSPKKSKKSKKNGQVGFEMSAEMGSDEIGVKKGSMTMTIPKLPKNNLKMGQNPFLAEPGSAEITIKGSGGSPKNPKGKGKKKGQIVVGVSAELESDEVGSKKGPKKSPKKSKKGKSKSKVKKGDDDDDDGQDQEVTVVAGYEPLKVVPKGGNGKITAIQTGFVPTVYQVPQQQVQTGVKRQQFEYQPTKTNGDSVVVVKTNRRKENVSPVDVVYNVETGPSVGFIQANPQLQGVSSVVEYNPGGTEITIEGVDGNRDDVTVTGRKETAGSAFRAGLKDGESAVNTDFVGDIAAGAVGIDGKVSDQDTIFEHALDGAHGIAGGLGGSLIDVVGDATGTGEFLTPVAGIAGTGLGLAANAKLAEIKGVVTGVKTAAVATGAQDLIGMQKRKKQG